MLHPSRDERLPESRFGTAPWTLLALLLFAVALCLGTVSCSGKGGRAGALEAAADEEWLWLQKAKMDLDAKRGLPSSPESSPDLVREIDLRTAEFDRRLVAFLNAHPPVQGEPLTHRQETALRMKGDEDLLVAREHVQKGGDYARAIEICEAALALDPDHPQLRAELARLRAARFMAADRFAQAKKGMTAVEVREALGAPNPKNVRAYPERGIEAWFYPKDETGAAAAVWFQKRPREEDTKAYELDFDAIGAIGASGAAPAPTPSPVPAPR